MKGAPSGDAKRDADILKAHHLPLSLTGELSLFRGAGTEQEPETQLQSISKHTF